MAKRKKDAAPTRTWEEADQLMGELRQLDAQLAGLNARFDKRIQQVQAAKASAAEPLVKEKEAAEERLLAFMEAHRGELPKGKSVKLVHGTVGLRRGSPKVAFQGSEEHTLNALKARGQTQCIRTVESLDKAELKKLSPAELRLVGAAIERGEIVYFKLNDDPIIQYPAAAGEGAT